MPRKPRCKSDTGIYHVVIRSVNKQVLFEADEDYEKFVQILKIYKFICNFELYAYCLMNNHVHLLLKEGPIPLASTMKRIGTKFVIWYNHKYKRTGHLFQDRYFSDAVESDVSFLGVLKYVHKNPLRAGVVESCDDYPWSSFHEYFKRSQLCDTDYVLRYFSDDLIKSREIFRRFMNEPDPESSRESEGVIRISDFDAGVYIKGMTGLTSPVQISDLREAKRNEILRHLKNRGLPMRQISRLTGVSEGVVRKI